MRVKKLLDKKGHDVYSVSPDTTVYNALKIMAKKEIGALIVVKKGKMVGIMSERDYARKVILEGKASKYTLVSDIMTTKIISVKPDTKLKKCLSLMTTNKIRHIPVLDGDKLDGVLSIDDIRHVT